MQKKVKSNQNNVLYLEYKLLKYKTFTLKVCSHDKGQES